MKAGHDAVASLRELTRKVPPQETRGAGDEDDRNVRHDRWNVFPLKGEG
jgi:hypothetical protein